MSNKETSDEAVEDAHRNLLDSVDMLLWVKKVLPLLFL